MSTSLVRMMMCFVMLVIFKACQICPRARRAAHPRCTSPLSLLSSRKATCGSLMLPTFRSMSAPASTRLAFLKSKASSKPSSVTAANSTVWIQVVLATRDLDTSLLWECEAVEGRVTGSTRGCQRWPSRRRSDTGIEPPQRFGWFILGLHRRALVKH